MVLPVRRGPVVKTYPNPAAHQLSIEREMQPEDVSGDWDVILHDALGRRVVQARWPSTQTKLELTLPTLPSGVYFLQTVDAAGGSETTRVIVEQQAVTRVPRA